MNIKAHLFDVFKRKKKGIIQQREQINKIDYFNVLLGELSS